MFGYSDKRGNWGTGDTINACFLFGVALIIILTLTLRAGFIGGWDAREEIKALRYFEVNSGWVPAMIANSNLSSSLLLGFLLPMLSLSTGIEWVVFARVIVPVLYCLVPVICYINFRNYLSSFGALMSATIILHYVRAGAMLDLRIMVGTLLCCLGIWVMHKNIKYTGLVILALVVVYYKFALLAMVVFSPAIIYYGIAYKQRIPLLLFGAACILSLLWLQYSTAGFFFRDFISYIQGYWNWGTNERGFFNLEGLLVCSILIGVIISLFKYRKENEKILVAALGTLPLLFLWVFPLWKNYEPYKLLVISMIVLMPLVGIAWKEIITGFQRLPSLSCRVLARGRE